MDKIDKLLCECIELLTEHGRVKEMSMDPNFEREQHRVKNLKRSLKPMTDEQEHARLDAKNAQTDEEIKSTSERSNLMNKRVNTCNKTIKNIQKDATDRYIRANTIAKK